MSMFCPTCSNMLLIGSNNANMYVWTCSTCPYMFPIEKQMTTRTPLPRKQVDDVMGGEKSWANVDKTDSSCPKCNHDKAYYMQIQIRSADEPATLFYKCCNCSHQWREG